MGGSIQVFTDRQVDLMLVGAADIVASRTLFRNQVNMTDVQRNASFAARADAKIADLQTAINGLDDKYASLKQTELDDKNSLIAEYQAIKTLVLNLPTSL